eukprot:241719-Prymnesium_polylepis.1
MLLLHLTHGKLAQNRWVARCQRRGADRLAQRPHAVTRAVLAAHGNHRNIVEAVDERRQEHEPDGAQQLGATGGLDGPHLILALAHFGDLRFVGVIRVDQQCLE